MMNQPACKQLRREIHAVIARYAHESDVTVYQILGVLEVVKIDLIEWLEEQNQDKGQDDHD